MEDVRKDDMSGLSQLIPASFFCFNVTKKAVTVRLEVTSLLQLISSHLSICMANSQRHITSFWRPPGRGHNSPKALVR